MNESTLDAVLILSKKSINITLSRKIEPSHYQIKGYY